MAGYLVHHEDVSTATVVYFELQAHEKGQAKMVLYENHHCEASKALKRTSKLVKRPENG